MRLVRFLASIVVAMMLSNCYFPFLQKDAETIVKEDGGATVRLIYNDANNCTAFHIGDGIFVSAAHCLGDYPRKELGKILLINKNSSYSSNLIAYSGKRDLILLKVQNWNGPKLELWDPYWDGPMPLGMGLLEMGFPSYFKQEFTFDYGQLRGFMMDANGTRCIVARDLSMPGYSGGPVVSLHNGKVVGIGHIIMDRTRIFEEGRRIEVWISGPVSVIELEEWLRELKLR